MIGNPTRRGLRKLPSGGRKCFGWVPLFAVLFGVHLRCFLVMFVRMQRMAVGDLGMVRGLFVIAGAMMRGGFAMMLGRVLVVLRGVFVVLVDLVIFHR